MGDKIKLKLLFLYLVLFPFGLLAKFILPFNPIDVLVLASSVYFKLNKVTILLIFSFLVGSASLNIWSSSSMLYLLRLVSYITFIVSITDLVRRKQIKAEILVKSLLIVGSFIALFGWVQYLFFPDLRTLYLLGWDDHYFRLTSTFLDPAFTGILLVLSILASAVLFYRKREKKYFALVLLLIITLGFTYSRASFLSLFISGLYLLSVLVKRRPPLFVVALIVVILLLILPKPQGEGGNLLRTKSILLKFENYSQSIEIIKHQPLFGVGYNNICEYKSKLSLEKNLSSHACAGLDNSILFLLSTTGLVGAITFISFLFKVISQTVNNEFGALFLSSLVAVGVHGQFTNTFFYTFVIGWLGLVYAASRNFKGSNYK